MKTEEQTAIIEATYIGVGDAPCFCVDVSLHGDSWAQSFGGYRSDQPGLHLLLSRIMKVAGASTWEAVKGEMVRVRHDGCGGRIEAIGHIMKDEWLTPDDIGKLLRCELEK